MPLGGYVKIAGMIDESMDKEQMKLPPQPWEFRSKPAIQRLLIMVAGVLMNFILALVIYIGVLYAWGDEYIPTKNVKYGIEATEVGEKIGFADGDKILSVDHLFVEDFGKITSTIVLNKAKTVQVERNGSVVDVEISEEDIALMLKERVIGVRVPFSLIVESFSKESPAKLAGVVKGDQVLMVNNQSFEFHDQFSTYIKENSGKQVVLTVLRNGQKVDLPVTLSKDGMLGVSWKPSYAQDFEYKTIKYGFFESIPAGIARGWDKTVEYLKQFKLIFNKTTKGYESLGGFLSIGNVFPGVWDWQAFW